MVVFRSSSWPKCYSMNYWRLHNSEHSKVELISSSYLHNFKWSFSGLVTLYVGVHTLLLMVIRFGHHGKLSLSDTESVENISLSDCDQLM